MSAEPAAPAAPAAPRPPQYTPPDNLPATIKELPGTRSGPAKALKKSIGSVLAELAKEDKFSVPEGQTVDGMAETFALQIERAVWDTHPSVKGQKEYIQQMRTLSFNLKSNAELVQGLLDGRHTPPTLAVMTSAQLASAEQQRETAELIAKAEKQSTLPPQDLGRPRVRRTHKGDELVEDESMANASDEPPPQPPGGGGGTGASSRRSAAEPAGKDTAARPIKNEPGAAEHTASASPPVDGDQRSPSQSNFDIGKVFSSVRSSSVSHPRRPSAQTPSGPGEDADVDRMLQEDNESPPYSPTEETQDPSIIWRGRLSMSSIADFPATAKHIAGADFKHWGPWNELIPATMSVAGRIPEKSATTYLCELRYSDVTDVIVVNLEPATQDSRAEFDAMINYFLSKNRFGVVGNKAAGNVRDTYLIPLAPGDNNNLPEFVYNLAENNIPKVRTEAMMLAAFVYRTEADTVSKLKEKQGATPTPLMTTPTPGNGPQRSGSISGPGFSPATPQAGPFNGPTMSQTPVPIPHIPYSRPQSQTQAQSPAQGNPHIPPQYQQQPQVPAQATPTPPQPAAPVAGPPSGQPQQQQPLPPQPDQMSEAQKHAAQRAGQAVAHEVLGPQLITAPTLQFLLPQAWKMSRREWEVVRNLFEREPKAKDDLQCLAHLLEKEGKAPGAPGGAPAGGAVPVPAPGPSSAASAPAPTAAPGNAAGSSAAA